MEFIDGFINQIQPLSEEASTLFKSVMHEKNYLKGEEFVSIGEKKGWQEPLLLTTKAKNILERCLYL